MWLPLPHICYFSQLVLTFIYPPPSFVPWFKAWCYELLVWGLVLVWSPVEGEFLVSLMCRPHFTPKLAGWFFTIVCRQMEVRSAVGWQFLVLNGLKVPSDYFPVRTKIINASFKDLSDNSAEYICESDYFRFVILYYN